MRKSSFQDAQAFLGPHAPILGLLATRTTTARHDSYCTAVDSIPAPGLFMGRQPSFDPFRPLVATMMILTDLP